METVKYKGENKILKKAIKQGYKIYKVELSNRDIRHRASKKLTGQSETSVQIWARNKKELQEKIGKLKERGYIFKGD